MIESLTTPTGGMAPWRGALAPVALLNQNTAFSTKLSALWRLWIIGFCSSDFLHAALGSEKIACCGLRR
jgi:hypothetical protein